jgi:hypothetical protein
MKTNNYSTLNTIREMLRRRARIAAIGCIVLALALLFLCVPSLTFIGLGVLCLAITWTVPWLGGALMIYASIWVMTMIPGAGWNGWTQLPYYIIAIVFLISGAAMIAVSVLGWITGEEWPRKKRSPET